MVEVSRRLSRLLPAAYVAWAAGAIAISVAAAGLSAETITRLLVLAFLLGQAVLRHRLIRVFPLWKPRARFVVLATLLASVVEGAHMISRPVFPSLRILPGTPLADALGRYAIDLLLTVPAYVVIFSVIFSLAERLALSSFGYAFIMALGQTLGDGGLFFFAANPWMLLFLPYPMTNYHACNLAPFLAVRQDLAPPCTSAVRAWLAVPALVLVYLACGAAIQGAGRALGLR